MEHRQEVVVKDIQMSFWSMVTFMVKWAIAAIPALVILWLLGVTLVAAGGSAFLALRSDPSPNSALETETETSAESGDPGASAAAAELAKFEILEARFSKQEQRFGSPEPIIHLRVRNGTDAAVSRAHFRGRLHSPGRAVPWVEEEFNYSISGGLEPGEEATWRLAPNQFSAWGSVDAPAGAVLSVEVLRLDGADGQMLWSLESM